MMNDAEYATGRRGWFLLLSPLGAMGFEGLIRHS